MRRRSLSCSHIGRDGISCRGVGKHEGIGIQSSPRGKNSNTLRLLNAALEGSRKAGTEAKLVDITKMNTRYSTGASTAAGAASAISRTITSTLLKKMLAANGILLSGPNYMSHVTAQLKTVLGRSVNVEHEQYLAGKDGFLIMTAGGGVRSCCWAT